MFNPTLNTQLEIDGVNYSFSPHPVVPSIVWGQEGRHAIVFRLQPDRGGHAYALKVFRPVFRHEGLVEAADEIAYYSELPGMRVCKQKTLTRETHLELINQYEDLDYAMLMPWIEGQTWFDILQTKKTVSPDQSRALTESMAWVLYALELNYLAHCDLSSGNVIVNPDFLDVDLIDVEDLYSPWVEPPPYVSLGSVGYQHKSVRESGQWGPLGDRFAGAVLMAEMLAWTHADVRKMAHGESYFEPDELQKENERYELLISVLEVYNPGFAEAFAQAWRSTSLDNCPPLKTWYNLLDALPREPVLEWAPIDLDAFGIGEDVEPEPEIAIGIKKETVASANAPAPVIPAQPQVPQTPPGRSAAHGCQRTATFVIIMSVFLCSFSCLFLGGLGIFAN